MTENKKGIKVWLYPDNEQVMFFYTNVGCCRKVHNQLLAKYNKIHNKDSTITPSEKLLNKLLIETKKSFPYLKKWN